MIRTTIPTREVLLEREDDGRLGLHLVILERRKCEMLLVQMELFMILILP